MSKQYVYAEGDQIHVISEASIIWNNQDVSQYFDANDTIINDCTINESYASALTGVDNETQYLSILNESDSAELTLEDLNHLTIDGEDVSSILLLNNNTPTNVTEDKVDEEGKNDNAEVVVFTLEGSDDLYGIQLMQDESGQMQKYQFKFRQTSEGQLEPAPETVTLLPNDEEPPVKQDKMKEQSDIKTGQYLLVSSSEDMNDDLNAEDTADHEKVHEEFVVKVEEVEIDQQNLDNLCSTSGGPVTEYEIPHIERDHYLETIEECDEVDESCNMNVGDPETVTNSGHFDPSNKNSVGVDETIDTDNLNSNEGQIFQHFMAPSSHVEVEYETEVEVTDRLGLHQEGFVDVSVKPRSENQIVLKETKYKRQSISNTKYCVVYPEKENLMAVPHSSVIKSQQSVNKITKCMKPNSRSVLRSSVAKNQEKQVTGPLKTSGSECDIYLKRFSKNKDALLAKRFHSFLNRTTIPQAPVRQTRQPRKQKIKPIVERSREEIIVQEVLVSSNGFVESHGKNCDLGPLRVTAIVELSDSDDESTSRLKSARKRTCKKRTFDKTVIEIHSDEEQTGSIQAKGTSHLNPKKLDHPPAKAKRKKVHGKIEASSQFLLKKEVICPHCPKTFPSQNSLNTHIIHHNLENSLKNKSRMSGQSMFTKPDYRHKCEKCPATFKNKILLEKHQCTSKQNSLNCTICLKQFRDMTLFNIHKKSHAKSNLIKNTTLTKVSPRKSYLQSSSSFSKSSSAKSVGVGSFKCSECPKVCDSESKLSTHMKMHKKFVCSFCSGTFASKVMLDTHIRTNCVKNKANKRLSYTVRKSFVHTPPRRTSVSKTTDLNQTVLGVKMNCDKCSMKFGSFRNLYRHKVEKHGMSTPDKSLLTKPKTKVFDGKAHGGVPANPRLQKAFAVLRQKLAEKGDLTIQ